MEVYGVYARGRRDPLVLSSIPLKKWAVNTPVGSAQNGESSKIWGEVVPLAGLGGVARTDPPVSDFEPKSSSV